MKICFLVGSIKISGGTYVIMQHAHYLQLHGHEVVLGVQERFTDTTAKWHDMADDLTIKPISDVFNTQFDIVIATWWKTALELYRFQGAKLAYFVQSIESRFYSEDQGPLRSYIEKTYDLDVHFCTEAKWIQKHLKDRHDKTAVLVPNGIRKDIYKPLGSAEKRVRPRVLIEGPFNVGFKNTGFAIGAAKAAGADDIWVLTSTPVRYIPYVDKVFSQVPIFRTNAIYQQCDVLIKLSTVEGMFGPPLEIFHCGGTAIVLDVTGHDEYIVDGSNGLVIKSRSFSDVVDSIKSLLDSPDSLSSLKFNASQTAKVWPDWDTSSARFLSWVNEIGSASLVHSGLQIDLQSAQNEYVTLELARLSKNKLITIKQKVVALLSRSPKVFANLIFQILVVYEVLFPHKSAR